jgi:hypothetical protein
MAIIRAGTLSRAWTLWSRSALTFFTGSAHVEATRRVSRALACKNHIIFFLASDEVYIECLQ